MTNLPEEIKPEDYGISVEKAKEVESNLPQILKERDVFVPQYDELIKSDINDPDTAKKARALRFLIKDNRTKGIVPWYTAAKEYFLRGGQFVDAIKNREIQVNERMEKALEEIEKHAEITEAKRKKELSESRFELIKVYLLDPQEKLLDLSEMDDDMFKDYLGIKKNQYDNHQANLVAKQQEEERLQKIKDLEVSRKDTLLDTWTFMSEEQKSIKLGEISQDEFDSLYSEVLGKKEHHEAEQKRIKDDNDRLAKEKAEQERKQQLEIERRKKIHTERSAKLNGLWGNMPEKYVDVVYVDLSEEDFDEMLSDAKKANDEAVVLKRKNDTFNERKVELATFGTLYAPGEIDGHIELSIDTSEEDYTKLINNLTVAKEKETKRLKNLQDIAEKKKAEEEAEKKRKKELAKKSISDQINAWISEFSIPPTNIDSPIVSDIKDKFEKFVQWSKEQADSGNV